MSTPLSPDAQPQQVQCSAKGCRAGASVDLQWRNPRLHERTRVKHWLACAEHVEYLSDYLSRRGFLLDVADL